MEPDSIFDFVRQEWFHLIEERLKKYFKFMLTNAYMMSNMYDSLIMWISRNLEKGGLCNK